MFGWFGGRGLSATIAGFRQMGIPPAATAIAAVVECFGGLAMLVGFLARPAALGLIVVMLVAVAKVHAKHGFFLNFALSPGLGHGYGFNLGLVAMVVAILICGTRLPSIDMIIRPRG